MWVDFRSFIRRKLYHTVDVPARKSIDNFLNGIVVGYGEFTPIFRQINGGVAQNLLGDIEYPPTAHTLERVDV